MFEITADDIAKLDDKKLRAVVARLCEAELRQRGLSSSYLTWGGGQNDADGGIDVRVAVPAHFAIDGFVPRTATGFQVKQQDMPRGEILKEMRPHGSIRPSIQSLADQGGAYVIVSSRGSTADSALTNRRDAMKEAMLGVRNAERLALDFYDCTRIATWVRSHEGLIPWVRQQVGRAIQGWHSYGSWSHPSDPITAEYLLDEELRIHPSKRETDKGVSALEGIRQIRDQLREPQRTVRLVGLSGTGKTRLVQALFDDRVGHGGLDPSLAIYTNMADSPDPQPTGLASDLVASGTRAILVIDNCPTDLHRHLSETCRQPQSRVSVITVEYDIKEDEPEGTDVFILRTSSRELIEKLLHQRFPDISQIDARTIADFSGGNARIATALAGSLERNETVAGLTDDELFKRLFLQRHVPDESLYLVAQACSLLYSFQGEDVSGGDGAELIRLGNLIEKTVKEVYRHVAELKRRDLVQQRGVWRAVLPQAIANRLAALALQNIPYTAIEEQLLKDPSGRMMRSFSRRLGYLHASKEARAIVKQWLGQGGLLENVANLNDLGRAMFENIAPVAPEEALSALERTCAEAPTRCEQYLELLRSLAYEPAYFDRCIRAMAAILVADNHNEQSHGRRLLCSLFSLCLSGTHATIEQRLAVLESLLASSDSKQRALGVAGLKVVLEAWHFTSSSRFDFGARSRDFGYRPRTADEVRRWFRAALNLIDTLTSAGGPSAPDACAALAEKFRGLWNHGGVRAEMASVCRKITKKCFWPEGWLAVRQTLDFDGKGMDAERLEQLVALERDLRPADLTQRVRSLVLSTSLPGIDFEDFEEHVGEDIATRMARAELLAKELGKAVATEEAVLASLLPSLVSNDGRLWSFGEGLAENTSDAADLWGRLVGALTATEESLRKPQVLRGFLCALRAKDSALAAALLDSSVEHETLAYWYPFLQAAVALDEKGIARLKRSLALGKTPIHMFTHLAYPPATDPIPVQDLKDLVLMIARMPLGYEVAVEILHMRLHAELDGKADIARELCDAGCEILRRMTFTNKSDQTDYRIGAIAKACLKGEQGVVIARELCGQLRAAGTRYATEAFYHDDLLAGVFSAQPYAALDGLCGGDTKELNRGIQVLLDVRGRKDPLAAVAAEDLIRWCSQEPQSRYPALARVIDISEHSKDGPRWTNIAIRFLEQAPDPAAVLKHFVSQFMPSRGWTGSLAAILESNATLLDQLEACPSLRDAVTEEKERLRRWVEEERERENERDRHWGERFE